MSDPGDTQLRELVAARADAVRRGDLAALRAQLAPGITLFNVVPPFVSEGVDEVAAVADGWHDAYRSAIGYEVGDVEVAVDGDLGVCWFTYRIHGQLTSGDDVDMRVRATLVCRRADGRWQIVHDHESVPMPTS